MMASAGLLDWANSLRLGMENDPGRQYFKDQIQSHGFSFLDDYLENIIAGSRKDPLIELVKTPGRKRVVRKTKPISILPTIVSMSLESIDDEDEDENITPRNSFGQVLLDAKDKSHTDGGPAIGMESHNSEYENLQLNGGAHDQTVASRTDEIESLHPESLTSIFSVSELSLPEQNELSMIIENDESQEALHKKSISTKTMVTKARPITTASISVNTFSSLSPNLPVQEERFTNLLNTAPSAYREVEKRPPEQAPQSLTEITPSTEMRVHSELSTKNANYKRIVSDPRERDIYIDADMPLRDLESSPKAGHIAPALPPLPSLPDPVPLRKSMRALREGVTTSISADAISLGPALGKRTSWLMKAREAKALEFTSKNALIRLPNSELGIKLGIATGTKRKSGEMLGAMGSASAEQGERIPKSSKINAGDLPSSKSQESLHAADKPETQYRQPTEQQEDLTPEAILDRFKKTVEGFNVKSGKYLIKSIGPGINTSALAEARTAAEARLAEKMSKLGDKYLSATPSLDSHLGRDLPMDANPISSTSRILSTSLELVLGRESEVVGPAGATPTTSWGSTSTTPPHSPPPYVSQSFTQPVFRPVERPAPVFVAPPTHIAETIKSPAPLNFLTTKVFSMPAPMPIGPTTPLESSSEHKADSGTEGEQSAPSTENRAPWLRVIDEDEHISRGQFNYVGPFANDLDEDDSWPLEGRATFNTPWASQKEDTWSTAPSQSQSHTNPLAASMMMTTDLRSVREQMMSVGGSPPPEHEPELGSELEDMVLRSGKPTVGLVSKSELVDHKFMNNSLSSTQSHPPGFIGQAAKLLQNALGASKKQEVKKVFQKTFSTKKQEEDTTRRKEELRQQQKVEDEKAKYLERERSKDENERRKTEREEQTDRRPFKPTVSMLKKDDDAMKKRKLIPEPEKKTALRKFVPPTLNVNSKLPLKPTTKTVTTSSATSTPANIRAPSTSKTVKLTDMKGKTKAVAPPEDDVAQPSQMLQGQMAARVKAQLKAAELEPEPLIASEAIELPYISSEYSDSEDEERPRTFDPPTWAQSPKLRPALETQSTINPDDVFGAIPPLHMEEIFKNRTSKFRARTSSANWTGADRLTLEEEQEYARRMGFR